MDVDILDENNNSIKNEKGELVCKKPFPSMPLKFWNDKNDEKFKDAYFSKYKNIWYHGDYAKLNDCGGFIIGVDNIDPYIPPLLIVKVPP